MVVRYAQPRASSHYRKSGLTAAAAAAEAVIARHLRPLYTVDCVLALHGSRGMFIIIIHRQSVVAYSVSVRSVYCDTNEEAICPKRWQLDAGTPCSHLGNGTDGRTDGRIAALL